ncbi:ATP-dependent DNA helicase [Demetria terragena]|uniref:ATP-dependent DNA helicase n=1 Tax=Demetria terragena TaxID=63959 RepID=UPI0003751E7D|nr:ATP-dependent DNA helicase [Demetria terragena]
MTNQQPVRSAREIAAALGQPSPTEEQVAIIEAPARPLLVVAGAGSGKTETMSARVVWLVVNGFVAPEEVLGLTFTRKAAGELAERIGRRLRRLEHEGLWTPRVDDDGTPGLGDSPTVSTYHAYAGRLVREHGLRLGIEPDSRMLSEAAAWQFAHEVVAAYDGPMEDIDKAESTVTHAVVALGGELAEHLRTTDEVRDYLDEVIAAGDALPTGSSRKKAWGKAREWRDALAQRRQLLPMVERYAELKAARVSLDFADQVLVAAQLAQRFPAIGVLERQRFRAVLLDEFQDTSEAQLVLLQSLFVARGEPSPVTAVGDPHQSIYGWRGASATTLTAFRERFSDDEGPAAVLPLSTSWRNDHAILDAANHTAAPLRTASLVPVSTLRARPDAGSGSVTAARFLTIEDEAKAIADWVRERWFDDSGVHTQCSAAVLCRKRSQFPYLAEAMTQAGLPVEVVGIGGLLTTPEVNDLVSLLWVVQDPTRGDRLMRLLLGPVVRLGAADLDGLAAWAREVFRERSPENDRSASDISGDSRDEASLVEALEELPETQWAGRDGEHLSEVALRRLGRLAAIIRRLRGLTGLPLAELVQETERALGLDIEVLARPEHTPSTARVHLDAFADVAARFAGSAERTTLGGFLDWLDAAEDEERGLDLGYLEVETEAVQILTVHAAKGLEWDAVAVPGLVEGSFPAHSGQVTWREGEGEASGWKISRDGRPGEPDSWVVNERGWTGGLPGVPYDLRGDAEGLPEVDWRTAADTSELEQRYLQFKEVSGRHGIAEERRLSYVALTRAKHHMMLSAHVWGEAKAPRLTSRFLTELIEGQRARLDTWVDLPDRLDEQDPINPRLDAAYEQVWPHDPLGIRRAQLSAGATRVMELWDQVPDQGHLPLDEHEDEVFVLLAERAAARTRHEQVVTVPRHLSTSSVVSLASDPEKFVRSLRRPMPQPPALAARRGTAFHAWVEQHFAQAALVDITELPGAADHDPAQDADLPHLKERFLASEWATQVPLELEVPVETVLDGVAVRGRIDAVFPWDLDPDADAATGLGYTVVDWKTGHPPNNEVARVRALQLAAYRVAYARLRNVPTARVRAAFFYAASGQTVWPELPGEEALIEVLSSIPG